ncbi:MAG: hypothetical protein AAF771_05890 [Pseudomonadota bacterium]
MATSDTRVIERAGSLCRGSASAIIAGLYRRKSISEINALLAARPAGEQAVIVGGVLAGLLVLSLLSAQFGWIGLLLFWLAVIVVVN